MVRPSSSTVGSESSRPSWRQRRATASRPSPTTFTQPGLLHRFLHLGARPEATFFFLVIGLTVAAFEFYAIGPGLAAVAAALSLFLASFGLSVLPVNWWAVAGAAGGDVAADAELSEGRDPGVESCSEACLLTWSGFNFSAGEPQVRTGVAGVVLSVLAVLFFYLLAIPTMGRARFSTQTIGREGLVGKTRTRRSPTSGPEGVVEVEGARWPATAHREVGDTTPEPKSWSWRYEGGASRSSQVAKIDLSPSIISLADPGSRR